MTGSPAADVSLDLYALKGPFEGNWLKSEVTNLNGRLESPLLSGDDFVAGRYRVIFKIADYFKAANIDLPNIPFLEDVSIDFGVSDASTHYHIPLLVSPYGYSTYRGS
jgi:5-hydroxyisourate hydrolase